MNEAGNIIKEIVSSYGALVKLKWYNFFKRRALSKYINELYQDLALQDFNIVSCDIFSILNSIFQRMPERYPHELDDSITLKGDHMVMINFDYGSNSCKIEFNMRTLHYKVQMLQHNSDLDINFEIGPKLFVPTQCSIIFSEIKANLFSYLYIDILKSITTALTVTPLQLPPSSEQ